MKKIIVLLIVLALASLACLDIVNIANPVSGPIAGTSATLTNEPTAGATGFDSPSATQTSKKICARVTAETAVNVRPAAAASGGVMTWLNAGDVVYVTDRSDSDWWLVHRSDVVGFVRSIYLQIGGCDD